MSQSPDRRLLNAVLEPRRPGAIAAIKENCALGANPNLRCEDASTSYGPVFAGMTLLTFSIHHEASRVVEALLAAGADPNLRDALGWTPWAASTLTDEKRERIQLMLNEAGCTQEGGHLGPLARAIYAGDLAKAEQHLESDDDLNTLSSFRVDLIAHQIANRQLPMLVFLLNHNMPCGITQLHRAVYASYSEAVEILIQHGIAVETADENETSLMVAARQGDADIVQMLVEHGADVNRCAFQRVEHTASAYAEKAGHTTLTKWLTARMDPAVLAKQEAIIKSRNPKFNRLYKADTSTDSLQTDDIVHQLEQWDARYPLKVTQATDRSVSLAFDTPPPWETISAELLAFCPALAETGTAVKKKLQQQGKITLWWE